VPLRNPVGFASSGQRSDPRLSAPATMARETIEDRPEADWRSLPPPPVGSSGDPTARPFWHTNGTRGTAGRGGPGGMKSGGRYDPGRSEAPSHARTRELTEPVLTRTCLV
jgi:hypothetical protein